ncbi:hypothetical protein OF83DRAFT_606019 [Amylostereum chailletii]|nr:hypothetical protein OF83DRAFT_606019 [Amylostereum chailletii]
MGFGGTNVGAGSSCDATGLLLLAPALGGGGFGGVGHVCGPVEDIWVQRRIVGQRATAQDDALVGVLAHAGDGRGGFGCRTQAGSGGFEAVVGHRHCVKNSLPLEQARRRPARKKRCESSTKTLKKASEKRSDESVSRRKQEGEKGRGGSVLKSVKDVRTSRVRHANFWAVRTPKSCMAVHRLAPSPHHALIPARPSRIVAEIVPSMTPTFPSSDPVCSPRKSPARSNDGADAVEYVPMRSRVYWTYNLPEAAHISSEPPRRPGPASVNRPDMCYYRPHTKSLHRTYLLQ